MCEVPSSRSKIDDSEPEWTDQSSAARGCIAKPPIGITPRWIGDIGRGIEILNGCVRYIEKRKKIPNDWIQELRGINRRMKK